jgi:hypothetical protein
LVVHNLLLLEHIFFIEIPAQLFYLDCGSMIPRRVFHNSDNPGFYQDYQLLIRKL